MTSRPVQWPSTSACGLVTALIIRRVIDGRVHRQLGVHAGHHDVEALQQFGLLVERAVLEDVDLDAGQDPHRRDRLAQFVDDVELLAQPLRRKPVGDRQARRMIGQRTVLVAQLLCRQHHLLDRRRPVRPVRVHVQVAAQRRPDLAATEILCRRAQFDQRVGLAAGPRLGDHLRGLGPDAGQRLPAVGGAVSFALGVGRAPRRCRRRCGRPSPGAGPRAPGPCSTRSGAGRRPDPWLQCAACQQTPSRDRGRSARRPGPRSAHRRRPAPRARTVPDRYPPASNCARCSRQRLRQWPGRRRSPARSRRATSQPWMTTSASATDPADLAGEVDATGTGHAAPTRPGRATPRPAPPAAAG